MEVRNLGKEVALLEDLSNDPNLWVWTLQPNILSRLQLIINELKNSEKTDLLSRSMKLLNHIEEVLKNPENQFEKEVALLLDNVFQTSTKNLSIKENSKYLTYLIFLSSCAINASRFWIAHQCWVTILRNFSSGSHSSFSKNDLPAYTIKNIFKQLIDHEQSYLLVSRTLSDLIVDYGIYFTVELADIASRLGFSILNLKCWKVAEVPCRHAVNLYEQLESSKSGQYTTELANAVHNLGVCLFGQSKLDQAEETMLNALKLYEELESSNPGQHIIDLTNVIRILEECGAKQNNYNKAETYARRAYTLYEQLEYLNGGKFINELASVSGRIGAYLGRKCLYKESNRFNLVSFKLYKKLEVTLPGQFSSDLARTAYNLGSCNTDLYNYEEAITYHRIACNMYEKLELVHHGKYTDKLADSYFGLGMNLGYKSTYKKAVIYTLKASTLYKKLELKHPGEFVSKLAHTYGRLGVYLSKLNKQIESESYDLKAYLLFKKLESLMPSQYTTDLACSASNLGVCLGNRQNWDQAEEPLIQAVELYEQLESSKSGQYTTELANAADYLGACLVYQNKWGQAEEPCRRAQKLYQQLETLNPHQYTTQLSKASFLLGLCLANLQKWSESLQRLEQAEQLDPQNAFGVKWNSLRVQSHVYLVIGRYELAHETILRALQEFNTHRAGLPTAGERLALQNTYAILFEQVQKVLLHEQVADFRQAFHWHCHKGRTLSEQIRFGHSGSGEYPLPCPVVAEPVQLALSLKRSLMSNYLGGRPLLVSYSFTGRDRLVVYLVPLWQVQEDRELPLSVKSFSLPDDTIRQLYLALSRSQWLEEYMSRGGSTSSQDEPFMWGTRSRQDAFTQAGPLTHQDFDAPVGDKQSDDPPWWDETLEEAKYQLWKTADELNITDDWDQGSFSWPAVRATKDLSLRAKRGRFLAMARKKMHHWAVQTTADRILQPWIDELNELEELPTEILIEPHGMLHVLPLQSAPVHWYDGQPQPGPLASQVPTRITPALSLAVHLSGKQPQDTPSAKRLLIAGPPLDSGLDHGEDECTMLSALVPEAILLQGRQMRLPGLRRQLQDQTISVLHLVTHGVYDGSDPAASYIQLDGQTLSARQLLDGELDLTGVDLVYLSSCEGTYGEGDLNDEVMGLVYGLLAAGARCVIGYLWPIDDNRSRAIAEQFYRRWLTRPQSAGQAYGQTLQWLQQTHPAWLQDDAAGWILHGDIRVRWAQSNDNR
ncbi:CHAT domain-containing protein [Rhodohalobacter mucosus]|uniref:CHAT domain-containing protein n=1 Tax=Rhodohalobacter mucosus TaxID=2079485 RepID=A0A316U0S5_9BACT|nr:CHAT domain-containing protein [Rhodohalobacter mucosus]PWN06366.1 hypothetical protein DDZ15_11130 [Rhodohalobacter mucosus]